MQAFTVAGQMSGSLFCSCGGGFLRPLLFSQFPTMQSLWGTLVEFDLAPWDSTLYTFLTYVFPVITHLAHSNSCLNPVSSVSSSTSLSKFWSVPSGTLGQDCGPKARPVWNKWPSRK